jgi:hypothetical protein
MTQNKPVKKFVVGSSSAAVWLNKTQVEDRTIENYSITVQRSYFDSKAKAYANTGNFRRQDVPDLKACLAKAWDYLNSLREE